MLRRENAEPQALLDVSETVDTMVNLVLTRSNSELQALLDVLEAGDMVVQPVQKKVRLSHRKQTVYG